MDGSPTTQQVQALSDAIAALNAAIATVNAKVANGERPTVYDNLAVSNAMDALQAALDDIANN